MRKSITWLIFFLLALGSESSLAVSEAAASFDSLNQANQYHDLPVTIISALTEKADAPAAIIISGDGGWYKFEQEIADKLAAFGIPTIGLDTKKYFRNRRTPEETASDIAECIDHYNKKWQKKRFLFIGYSLGAELVPFIINRLPDELRSEISMFVLLSPAATTDFQIHISDMIGVNNKHDTYKVVDEIEKLNYLPGIVIYGADEKTDIPALLSGLPVRVVKIPGDHHYNHDTSIIVETMRNYNAF